MILIKLFYSSFKRYNCCTISYIINSTSKDCFRSKRTVFTEKGAGNLFSSQEFDFSNVLAKNAINFFIGLLYSIIPNYR